jgi:F-type H+-transporting ATPase subunit gamma
MAVNTKAIKSRIKTVENTKKITKAMEMVSAAKMRKSVDAVLNTRAYASLASELMEHMGHLDDPIYELLQPRPVKNILVILVSSNRGLCGSYNSNVFKKTLTAIKDKESLTRQRTPSGKDILPIKDAAVHIIGVGKKSAAFAKRNDYNLVAVFGSLSEKPNFDDIVPISTLITKEFKNGTYDKVVVAYTDYVSSLSLVPKLRQLLPISPDDLEKMLAEAGTERKTTKEIIDKEDQESQFPIASYIFEPNDDDVVEYVLPRLVEIQLYQAVLESAASEHSARMLAMRNASDAAGEMITELNLTFNKARQAAITQEIAEIAGGAAAME